MRDTETSDQRQATKCYWNPYTLMRMRVRIWQIYKSKDKYGGFPYIRMRVRLRMIFKYTEIA